MLYRFADFEFDAERFELRKNGKPIALKLQPARLLSFLLQNAPQTVTRSALQKQIWDNGTLVEFEQGLNACVNQLRNALGDTASNPEFISTQPKRGYKFIHTVERARPKQTVSKPKLAAIISGIFVMLAVIIWYVSHTNSPTSPTRIYVAPIQIEGDDLSTFDGVVQYALRLGTIQHLMGKDLNVLQTINGDSLWKNESQAIPQTTFDFSLYLTLARYEEEYRVEAIIIGAANREFDRQDFQTQLLDPASLTRLSEKISNWAGSVFGVRHTRISPIAPDIARNPGYFEAMLKARHAFKIGNDPSLRRSLTAFNEALEIHPASSEAMGGKALALAILAGRTGFATNSTYTEALALAKSIRQSTGPTVASELTRGFIFLYRDWDLKRARQAFDLAESLAPGDALTHAWRAAVLAAQGDSAWAARQSDLAVRLDPLSMAVSSDRCWYLGAAGRFDEAVTACRWALDLQPGSYTARLGLVTALEHLGRVDEAHQELVPVWNTLRVNAGLAAIDPASKTVGSEVKMADLRSMYCDIADQLTARVEQGQFPLFQYAAFNAQCGRDGIAWDYFEKARTSKESGMLFYDIEPRLQAFRSRPQAKELYDINEVWP